MSRKDRITAWLDTQKLFTHGILKHEKPGKSFEAPFIDAFTEPQPSYITTTVVQDIDTLLMASEMVSRGLHPLVLNMASDYHPGGGVARGASAQEEELFRRTNYCFSITKAPYPLVNKAILTQNIMVIKDTNYNLLTTPFRCDFIACPALRKPILMDDCYNKYDRHEMRKRIFNIFDIALHNNNDSLVLGALGCGAFKNPPVEVAELFQEAVDFYKGAFKEINFAVLDMKTGNYQIFKDRLLK